MDRVHDELEDAKAQIEKLQEDYQLKAEESDNLKRAHNDQIIKIQTLNAKLKEQNDDLVIKADEIQVFKNMYEDLRHNLKEKDDIIKRLSSQNDKLRVDSQEKIKKCEDEKRDLLFAMEEGNEKNFEKEGTIQNLKEENEILKGRILEFQKAGIEAKEMANFSKELSVRDELLVKFEEEKKKVEEELKWKKEKFEHLKEAHEKLLEELKSKEREWETEKYNLIDEISNIQSKLDCQIEVAVDLKSRLETCKQTLVLEERKRRNLEVKVRESVSSFDNVFAEHEDVPSNLKSLIDQRDRQIASLKELMGSKESDYKEMEHRYKKIEKENEELKVLVKAMHEERILEARDCNKPRRKNAHKESSKKLEPKEADLGSQIEKIRVELNSSILELKGKDELIKELEQALGIKEPRSMNIHDECLKILEAREAKLPCQIEKMKDELSSCVLELKCKDELIEKLRQESEKTESLIMDLLMKNEEYFLTALVLKSFLKEKKRNFAEENLPVVPPLKKKYEQACDDLDKANDELAWAFTEVNKVEFELQIWKSIAERLNSDLEENYKMRREMEDSLLAQVTIEVNLKEENRILVDSLEEKDSRIKNLESLEFSYVYEEIMEKMKTSGVMKEVEIQENLLGLQQLENELRIKECEVKKLTNFVKEFFDRMTKVCDHDIELMGKLGNIVKFRVNHDSEDLFKSEKENVERDIVALKKVDVNFDCRSPLRTLNTLV